MDEYSDKWRIYGEWEPLDLADFAGVEYLKPEDAFVVEVNFSYPDLGALSLIAKRLKVSVDTLEDIVNENFDLFNQKVWDIISEELFYIEDETGLKIYSYSIGSMEYLGTPASKFDFNRYIDLEKFKEHYYSNMEEIEYFFRRHFEDDTEEEIKYYLERRGDYGAPSYFWDLMDDYFYYREGRTEVIVPNLSCRYCSGNCGPGKYFGCFDYLYSRGLNRDELMCHKILSEVEVWRG